MTRLSKNLLVTSLVLLGAPSCVLANGPAWKNLPSTLYVQSRRLLNLNSIFGHATYATPFDRLSGHPVFQVTTPYGSPYMNMEKLTDLDENVRADAPSEVRGASKTPQSLSEEQNEYRTVCLYFMDPDDALAVHGEMNQMDSMSKADIRITASSLGRAIRSAANLGNGLVTGYPPETLTGKLKTVQEGGSLRYKIVPPKRQLYYAARCKGRERIGLFSESPAEDAQASVVGNSALEGLNLLRRREKRERKIPKRKTAAELASAHMEGYTGIPVFYAPNLQRQTPLLKKVVSGVPQEIPMFFNYEDLQEAWKTMRQRNGNKRSIPEAPVDVEVFNMWDLVTSMEREMLVQKETRSLQERAMAAVKNRFTKPKEEPGLEAITFVPSSRCVHYKEHVSALGNGKARLRPMR